MNAERYELQRNADKSGLEKEGKGSRYEIYSFSDLRFICVHQRLKLAFNQRLILIASVFRAD